MEIYSANIRYQAERPSDDLFIYSLWATLEGAKRGLKEQRDNILRHNSWLNNDDCIETDEEEHFFAHDDQMSYEITINKESINE